jgi:Tfp pilus assembly protein PilO
MASRGFRGRGYGVHLAVAAIGLALLATWGFKVSNIQRLKRDISELEKKLGRAQGVWKNYPPLSADEKRKLEAVQQRLVHLLPKDKDIPFVFEIVTRLAQERGLKEISFAVGDGSPAQAAEAAPGPPAAGSPVVVAPPEQPPPKVEAKTESGGPIDSFRLKVGFSGDYRDIAGFLDELEQIPRLNTIESVRLWRGVPALSGELLLKIYYRK